MTVAYTINRLDKMWKTGDFNCSLSRIILYKGQMSEQWETHVLPHNTEKILWAAVAELSILIASCGEAEWWLCGCVPHTTGKQVVRNLFNQDDCTTPCNIRVRFVVTGRNGWLFHILQPHQCSSSLLADIERSETCFFPLCQATTSWTSIYAQNIINKFVPATAGKQWRERVRHCLIFGMASDRPCE